jgi:hypothetical protein
VNGANLHLVAKLRLKSAIDSTDTVGADGDLSVSGDTTAGKVAFKEKDLRELNDTRYSVFRVDKSGREEAVDLVIKVKPEPAVTLIAPASVSLASLSGTNQTLSLTGRHLDAVKSLQLLDSDGKSVLESALKVAVDPPHAAMVDFSTNDLKKLSAGDYALGFVLKNGATATQPDNERAKLTIQK